MTLRGGDDVVTVTRGDGEYAVAGFRRTTLDGGAGADELNGGAGADRFTAGRGDEVDCGAGVDDVGGSGALIAADCERLRGTGVSPHPIALARRTITFACPGRTRLELRHEGRLVVRGGCRLRIGRKLALAIRRFDEELALKVAGGPAWRIVA